MRERNKRLDAIKGFAIIMVMIGHCIVLNHMEDGIVYDGIKAIQMPLFMLVSGYIAGLMVPINQASRWKITLKKRSIAYLLPFFSWMLFDHWQTFFLELKMTFFQLDRGLWFLVTLYILSTVLMSAEYIRYGTKLGRIGFALVWICFTSILLLQLIFRNRILSPNLTIYQLPFYLGGYVIARDIIPWADKRMKQINWDPKKSKLVVFGLWTLSLISFILLILRYDMVVAHNKGELLIQMLASVLGCFVCFVGIVKLPSLRLLKVLSFIGFYTLEIYVLHFRFARIFLLEDKHLSLISIEGGLWILATFVMMSMITGLLIILLRQFWLLNLVLFGKMKKKEVKGE